MSHANALIFQPWSLRSLQLRNRVVMAPMTRRKADDDGIATPTMARYYARRAEGGVGLIISEGTSIDGLHAFDTLTVPRFETPDQIAGWRQVVDAVHAAGGHFAPQLWHTGRLAANPIGPSAGSAPPRRDGTPRPDIREMENADFEQVLGAYRHSAEQALAMGCDAVEIHGAHGYLLDSFLSPVDNQRSDDYGGSPEARRRFPLEVIDTVRAAVGPDLPVIYRFSQWKIEDYAEVKFPDPDALAPWLDAMIRNGVDLAHVSTRGATDPAFPRLDGADGQLSLAGWVKRLTTIPVIAVGKVTTTLAMDEAYGEVADQVSDPAPALDMIERGEADLLAVGRALIANPTWVELVRNGRWKDLQPFHKGLLDELI